MASVTIRNLPDNVKEQLRIRAAHHGKALETELRDMLIQIVAMPTSEQAIGQLLWPESGFPVPYLDSGLGPLRVDTGRDSLYD